jgi:ectoine hydroxylase-related dioxygenase (phytanoyl-CoA dioxygenase family)
MAESNGLNGLHGSNGTARVSKRLNRFNQPPSLVSFQKLCSQSTCAELYPHASAVASNIPIYDMPSLPTDAESIDRVQDEWHHILLSGPGVVVLRHFYTDMALLERVNDVFSAIIDREEAAAAASTNGGSKGDHFAAAGKNSRIWNSFQKHADQDPASFVPYYSNPWLRRVCECWLGPAYQVTAQVNLVRPGGRPQVSHRDYHLGFQTAESCSRFPKATQVASQFLTLQGAVAHCAMPLDSGPTRFLPFSQTFDEGFMAYRLKEFQEYFDRSWVSVALEMGDAVFFNPALFHAAGENKTSDVERSANLLQISSAFGRTMESIDTATVISKCWDDVRRLYAEIGNKAEAEEIRAILTAIGEGYPFPTNLDRRPPAPGGMAPESETDVLQRGLQEGWNTDKVVYAIMAIRKDSMP